MKTVGLGLEERVKEIARDAMREQREKVFAAHGVNGMAIGSTLRKPGEAETRPSAPAPASTTDSAVVDRNGRVKGINVMDTQSTPAAAPARWLPPAGAPSSNPGHTPVSTPHITDVKPSRLAFPALPSHSIKPQLPSPKRGLDVEDLWRDAVESMGPWSVGPPQRRPAPLYPHHRSINPHFPIHFVLRFAR